MNKKNIMKWINALRSGKYKQTKGALQDSAGYCCLGVACDLFIPKDKLELRAGVDDQLHPRVYERIMFGGLPSIQPYAPDWLKDLGEKEFDGFYLSDLNDSGSLTFNEIADILQIEYIEGL